IGGASIILPQDTLPAEVIGHDRRFHPNCTLSSLARVRTHCVTCVRVSSQGVKKLDPALFSEFEGRVFGDECVCRLDLAQMDTTIVRRA
ncbi:hypothetical protein M9458_039392, partial [Cirrhinus mrigala]